MLGVSQLAEDQARASLEPLSSVLQPSIDVLAHSGQDQAKKPAVPAGGFGLQEMEIILFAFDRAFGTRASVEVELEEIALSGNKGVQAIVFLGVGVDDPAIVRT